MSESGGVLSLSPMCNFMIILYLSSLLCLNVESLYVEEDDTTAFLQNVKGNQGKDAVKQTTQYMDTRPPNVAPAGRSNFENSSYRSNLQSLESKYPKTVQTLQLVNSSETGNRTKNVLSQKQSMLNVNMDNNVESLNSKSAQTNVEENKVRQSDQQQAEGGNGNILKNQGEAKDDKDKKNKAEILNEDENVDYDDEDIDQEDQVAKDDQDKKNNAELLNENEDTDYDNEDIDEDEDEDEDEDGYNKTDNNYMENNLVEDYDNGTPVETSEEKENAQSESHKNDVAEGDVIDWMSDEYDNDAAYEVVIKEAGKDLILSPHHFDQHIGPLAGAKINQQVTEQSQIRLDFEQQEASVLSMMSFYTYLAAFSFVTIAVFILVIRGRHRLSSAFRRDVRHQHKHESYWKDEERGLLS